MSRYTYTDRDIDRLEKTAVQIREDFINMTFAAGSGHPGGSLSAADMITALYFHVMNIDPQKPDWPDRDRFILSKGHACPALYSALARRGYFSPDLLTTLRQYHSILQGHPDMKKTPGVDMSSGSLGNGFAAAVGMALSARKNGQDYRTYVLLGDGELQEGIVWESAMAGAHFDLKNLTAIVDCNGVQINGWVNDIMSVEPLTDKWKAFGWSVVETDGHDMRSILNSLHTAESMRQPTVILMRTVKGKGVSFMEDESIWHGKAPNEDEMIKSLMEIKNGGAKT